MGPFVAIIGTWIVPFRSFPFRFVFPPPQPANYHQRSNMKGTISLFLSCQSVHRGKLKANQSSTRIQERIIRVSCLCSAGAAFLLTIIQPKSP